MVYSSVQIPLPQIIQALVLSIRCWGYTNYFCNACRYFDVGIQRCWGNPTWELYPRTPPGHWCHLWASRGSWMSQVLRCGLCQRVSVHDLLITFLKLRGVITFHFNTLLLSYGNVNWNNIHLQINSLPSIPDVPPIIWTTKSEVTGLDTIEHVTASAGDSSVTLSV